MPQPSDCMLYPMGYPVQRFFSQAFSFSCVVSLYADFTSAPRRCRYANCMNRLLFGIAALLAALPANALKVTSLRCDAQEKPLAIPTGKPEFSWLLDPDKPAQKNLRQSAYRILVASSRSLIDRN